MKLRITTTHFLLVGIIEIFTPFLVLASATNGAIDGTYKYAWSENIGWLNFGNSYGNVHVTDTAAGPT